MININRKMEAKSHKEIIKWTKYAYIGKDQALFKSLMDCHTEKKLSIDYVSSSKSRQEF